MNRIRPNPTENKKTEFSGEIRHYTECRVDEFCILTSPYIKLVMSQETSLPKVVLQVGNYNQWRLVRS